MQSIQWRENSCQCEHFLDMVGDSLEYYSVSMPFAITHTYDTE